MDEDINNKDSSARVQFHEYKIDRSSTLNTPKKSTMAAWVIKYSGGRIKYERQANYVLIAFVALSATVLLFLVFNGGIGSSKQNIYEPKSNINARLQ